MPDLARHVPVEGEQDLRGFEWYHLKWESRRRWKNEWQIGQWGAIPSPRGDMVAFVSVGEASITLRDASNFEVKEVIETNLGPGGNQRPTFFPQGSKLAYSDHKGLVVRALITQDEFRLETDSVTACAISSDETLVAVLSGAQITVWDLEKREKNSVLNAAGVRLLYSNLAFIPETKTISYCCEDNSLVAQDVEESSSPQVLLNAPGPIDHVSYSPDGRLLFASTESELSIIPLNSVNKLRLYSFLDGRVISGREVISSHTALDGTRFAVGYGDGSIELWDLGGPSLLERLRISADSRPWLIRIDISDDGNLIATFAEDGTLEVFNRSQQKKQTAHCDQGWWDVATLRISPDNRLVAIGHPQGLVSVWDTDSLKLVRSEQVIDKLVHGLEFFPDGRKLAVETLRQRLATFL